MIKLRNPFSDLATYKCFGCSPNNSHGLRMEFYEDGDEIISTWNPENYFQGYIDVLHGGVQSTLMDEIASWVVFVKLKTGGVTSRLTSRFRKPVMVNEGPLTLRAKIVNRRRNIADIEVKLFNSKGILCAESVAEYFVLSGEKAKEAMNFPDPDAFYE
jgi:uncharacterized protein (TIGR00369 family)